MSKNKKYGIVLFIFVVCAIYDFGGTIFTDGIYSLLVFYMCYSFLLFDSLKTVNVISLYRYGSIKELYIRYIKQQLKFSLIYLFVFFVCGMITGVLSAIFDRGFIVSTGALIKFLIISYVNLIIVACTQLTITLLAGKRNAVIIVSTYILVSMTLHIMQIYTITPFILNTAYFRWKKVITAETLLSYIVCMVIVLILAYLPCKKDRRV